MLYHTMQNFPYSLKCPYVAGLGKGCTARVACASISGMICLAGLILFSGLNPKSLNNWAYTRNQIKPGLLSSGEELVNEMAQFSSN